jgi:hypothetical protein
LEACDDQSQLTPTSLFHLLLGGGYAGLVLGLDQRLGQDCRDLQRPLARRGHLDTLAAELLAVVDQTMQPTRTWLWLRSPDSRRTAL